MAGADAIVCVAAASAFASGMLLIPALVQAVKHALAFDRARDRAFGEERRMASLLRRGVRWCMPVARTLLRVPTVAVVFREAETASTLRGYPTTAENLCSLWCAAMCCAVVAGTVVGSSPVFGIALAACASVVGRFAVEKSKEARIRSVREGVPDVLRAMEACFFAGLSLLQTFQHIADETSGPLKTMFAQAAHELEMGGTTATALASFRCRTSVSELSFVAVALEVQHDAGGSMKQVLAAARDSVESDLELRRSLQVQTAQAKLSARVVTAMPFVLIAVFSLITENFLAPFFSSVAGLLLLAVAVAMQVAGILSVRNLLKVGFD